jgi:hypothetical protein
MPKEILKKLIYSLAIPISVSILGGLFCLNFGFNFWITTLFFFILQFIGFYFYGEYVKRRNAIIEAELEMIAAAELAKITADVVCPCDKKVQNRIPIEMNVDNSYTCSQCNKRIGVIVDVKTTLKTEPLEQNPLADPLVIKNVEEAIKDPTHNDRI